jgi:hypothetical protein
MGRRLCCRPSCNKIHCPACQGHQLVQWKYVHKCDPDGRGLFHERILPIAHFCNAAAEVEGRVGTRMSSPNLTFCACCFRGWLLRFHSPWHFVEYLGYASATWVQRWWYWHHPVSYCKGNAVHLNLPTMMCICGIGLP